MNRELTCLVSTLPGAEVVKADIDDKASLVKVLEGAYGCFGVTNFWEHLSKEKEAQQVRRKYVNTVRTNNTNIQLPFSSLK